MDNELISIVVPVYNAEKYIQDTLNNILEQTYPNFELLLVDDCSNDNSFSILKKYEEADDRIHVYRLKENSGPAAARNEGISHAKGRYLVYQDADDLWNIQKLEHQLAFTREHGYAFTFTSYEFADEEGNRNGKIVHVPAKITYEEALSNTTISTITVMFDRMQIKDEILKMPEGVGGEDTATWWKILRHGYTAYGLDENLSVYRRYSGSRSSNKLYAIRVAWCNYRYRENLPILKCMKYFTGYVVRAIKRRL